MARPLITKDILDIFDPLNSASTTANCSTTNYLPTNSSSLSNIDLLCDLITKQTLTNNTGSNNSAKPEKNDPTDGYHSRNTSPLSDDINIQPLSSPNRPLNDLSAGDSADVRNVPNGVAHQVNDFKNPQSSNTRAETVTDMPSQSLPGPVNLPVNNVRPAATSAKIKAQQVVTQLANDAAMDSLNPFTKNVVVRKATPIISSNEALHNMPSCTAVIATEIVNPDSGDVIYIQHVSELTTLSGIVVDQTLIEDRVQVPSPPPIDSLATPSDVSVQISDVTARTNGSVNYSFDETDLRYAALMKLNDAIRLCRECQVDRTIILQQLNNIESTSVPSFSGPRYPVSSNVTAPASTFVSTATSIEPNLNDRHRTSTTVVELPEIVNCAALCEDLQFEHELEPLGMKYVDTHCHLDLIMSKCNFQGTYTQFRSKFKDCWSKLYGGCITSLCFPAEFKNRVKFYDAMKIEDGVKFAIGCHPRQANLYNDVVEDFLFTRLSDEDVIAYGECGLDFSPKCNIDPLVQIAVLKRQLRVAAAFGKPIVLHCRNAAVECLKVLKEALPHDYPLQWHSFSEDFETAKVWSDHFTRLYFGITPAICSQRSHLLMEFVEKAPLMRLLVETDSPYFLPDKYKLNDLRRDGLNESNPGLGSLVVQKIAEAKKTELVETMSTLLRNTQVLYDAFY